MRNNYSGTAWGEAERGMAELREEEEEEEGGWRVAPEIESITLGVTLHQSKITY